MLTSFVDLERIAHGRNKTMRVIVAAANDRHTLEGVNDAYAKGVIEPMLIGDAKEIRAIIGREGLALGGVEIVETADDAASAREAAALVVSGYGDVLMKGKLQTADLLREVVRKEN